MVRTMCGVQLNDKKRVKDIMQVLGLKETMDYLPIANSVHRYGHVLRRKDNHILGRALQFEV